MRFLALAMLLASPALAQSLPDWAAPSAPEVSAATMPPPPPGGGGGTVPQQVPLDGGLGLLMLAGAGYAARTLRTQ